MLKLFASETLLYLCNEWVSKIPSHWLRLIFYRKLMGFTIGAESNLFMHCNFDCKRGLSIGNNSVINAKCRLDTRGGITIGDKVSISQEVIILTADHDANASNFAGRSRSVTIEDYVWIGTRAMILPGVTVGKGALIAAGSIVTKDVKPFSIVAGSPARIIKMRPENLDYPTHYQRLFQ